MEINEYRPKQARLHKAATEYEASQIKAQHIKPSGQNQKPAQINKNEHSIVKGEIIDLRYQEVKIRLEPSGQVISAKLSGEVPLSIGQSAEFVVSDEADGVITLRYVQTSNSSVNDILHKALYASGLTASERNLSIVQELLNYQMPVDKNTILQLIKLTSAHPDVNSSTLVLMHKNGLPINLANIAQFEAYQRGMHQILNQLKSLIGQISTISSDNTTFSKNVISHDIMQANNDMVPEESYPTSSINNAPSNNVNLNNMINLHRELLTLVIDEEGRNEQISPDTLIGSILMNDDMTKLRHTLLGKLSDSSLYNKEAVESIQNQLSNGSMTFESLLTLVHDLYDSDSSLFPSDKSMVMLHIADAFISMSSQLSSSDREKLVNLLKSDAHKEILIEALHQRWTLSPEELTKGNKVKEFFSRLEKDIESLDKLTDSFSFSSEIKSSISKLQNNLQFMRDLNELFLYLQLPIRFKEQDAHGDLYVFTRKNQKHRDKEDLNVLLHLDMTNLGSIDIHMSMRNHLVNAIFYIEKSSEQIISEHLHELAQILSKKGYQLHAKTQISESKPDFITDILQSDAPSSSTHRYTFDIRA